MKSNNCLTSPQAADSLHQILDKFPKLKLSREHRVASQDVAWWLEEHTMALVQYMDQCASLRDCPAGSAASDALLRRRAAQSEVRNMLMLAVPGQVHQSCTDRLRRECTVI